MQCRRRAGLQEDSISATCFLDSMFLTSIRKLINKDFACSCPGTSHLALAFLVQLLASTFGPVFEGLNW